MKLRFDEVLYDLEQERLRVDEDLRRFAAAAAYLRRRAASSGTILFSVEGQSVEGAKRKTIEV